MFDIAVERFHEDQVFSNLSHVYGFLDPEADKVLEDPFAFLVLCEIEEEGAKPKLVIGDIANIFLAKNVRIKKKDYTLADSKFILGVRVGKGVRKTKKQYAESKVASIGELVSTIIDKDAMNGIKVITVPKPTYEELVKEIEEVICNLVNIQMA